jgi:hypothetical protein
MMLSDLHNVPCLLYLELSFMLNFFHFDDDSWLLFFVFPLSQGMIVSTHNSFP